MKKLIALCVVAFLSLCLLLQGNPKPGVVDSDVWVALTNAKIVAMPGSVLEKGTVLVRNDKIEAVGETVDIPAMAEIIDCSGKIIYAGFIDCGSHLGLAPLDPQADLSRVEDAPLKTNEEPVPSMPLADRSGIRSSYSAREQFSAQAPELEVYRKHGFCLALITPNGGILSGSSALLSLGEDPLRRAFVDDNFAQHASLSVGDWSGWETPNYPGTTMGCIAQLRQFFMDMNWYLQLNDYAMTHPVDAPRVPSDLDYQHFLKVVNREQYLVFYADNADTVLRAAALAKEFNFKLAIQGAAEAWKIIPQLKELQLPLILSLDFPPEPYAAQPAGKKDNPGAEDKQPGGNNAPENSKPEENKEPAAPVAPKDMKDEEWAALNFEPLRVAEERRRKWKEFVDNAKALHAAGIPFAVGSFSLKPPELIANLRMAVEEGLPADAALTALTTAPAKMLGQSLKLGAIAPGRVANLLVFDGPFENKKSKIDYVFIDGEKFDLARAEAAPKAGGDDAKGPRGARKRGAKPNQPAGADKPADAPGDSSEETPDEERPKNPLEGQVFPDYPCELDSDRHRQILTGGNLLLKNATVLTVSHGKLDNTSILVKNGIIAEIGQNLSAPEGTRSIDLTGYVVMPGIVDPHSHIGPVGGLNEYTMSITPEVRVREIMASDNIGYWRALCGGVTSLHVMHGSANTIGGQNVTVRLKYPASDPDDMIFPGAPRTVKFALGENVTQANSDQARGRRYPNSRTGVEDTLREAFHQATIYRKHRDLYEEARLNGGNPEPFRYDLRLDALCDILDGDIHIHTHCYRADEVLRLLEIAEEYQVRIACLHHILEGYRIMPEIARHGCGASTFSDWWGYKVEAFNAVPHNAAMMMNAGISSSINSDSAATIRHLFVEAAKSIRFGGLGEQDALRLITLEPARQLRIDKWVGSIDLGKDADFAVFNGHPLDTFSKCVMTIVQGDILYTHPGFNIDQPAGGTLPVMTFGGMPATLDVKASPNGKYAIVGATVHTVSGGDIESGTVIVENGKITAVGANLPAPGDASVIDGKGLHLYPGMIAGSSTLGVYSISAITATVDNAELGRHRPHTHISWALDPHNVHLKVTRAEGITSAITLPSGGQIPGQACLIRMDGWTADELLIDDSLALVVDVPMLPDYLGEKPEQKEKAVNRYREEMAELRDYFDLARRYAKAKAVGEDKQPWFEIDREMEAMIPYVNGKKPVILNATGYRHIRDAIRFAEIYALKPILNGGGEAWKLADELAAKKIPVILGDTIDFPHGDFEPFDSYFKCAAILQAKGVLFCFSSGTSMGGSALAKQLPVQAGMAVSHGLPEDAAVRALTLNAATILGRGELLGSIEAGKQADLILVSGHLCQASSRVVAEFINGRPVALDSLHEENFNTFANRPAPRPAEAQTLNGPASLTEAAK